MKVLFDEPRPLTIHLLINGKCNLSCNNCFYKGRKGKISLPAILTLFGEWYEAGVQSVAIGGGEPLLHPDIDQIIANGKACGFYMALTTNGTILHDFPVPPERVHISADSMHGLKMKRYKKAIKFYKKQGCQVGVNHILTSLKEFRYYDRKLKRADKFTILLEKPESNVSLDERLEVVKDIFWNPERYWFDACFSKRYLNQDCKQGFSSFAIDSDLMCSRCSNVTTKFPYMTIKQVWRMVSKDKSCLHPDLEVLGRELAELF